MTVGVWQILIVALLVALLFGRRLSNVGHSLGRSVREGGQAISGAIKSDPKKSSDGEHSNQQAEAVQTLGRLFKLWLKFKKLRSFPFSLFK